MKKVSKDEIKILLDEIKKLADEAKKENKYDYSKITSKDVMFFFLAQITNINDRLTKVETTQKMFCWFAGISISAIAVVLSACGIFGVIP